MPNPYIDSLKIAKDLEVKAKEFQEKKKKIQKNVEELRELCDILEGFGITADEERSKINEISLLVDKKDVEGAQKKYLEIREGLQRSWIKYYSSTYRREMEEIVQSLGKNYDKYTTDLVYKESVSELNNNELKRIRDGIIALSKIIKQKIGSKYEDVKNYDLKSLEEDSLKLATLRQESNERIKEILARVSPVELYAIKYKIDIASYEKIKKEATQLFKDDDFKKTLSLMTEYEKGITESIAKKVDERLTYLNSRIKEAESIEVDIEEYKKTLETIESSKKSPDILQMSDRIRRMEQGIDRKMFDETVQKLSKTNSVIKDTFADEVPEELKNNVNKIRDTIMQNDLTGAYGQIKEVERQIDEIKASQNDLRKKLEDIATSIRSAPFSLNEINSLVEEHSRISSVRLIDKEKVDKFEAKINKRIEKEADMYISEIEEAQSTIRRYKGDTEFIPNLGYKKKDLEVLQTLLAVKSQISDEFKKLANQFNEKLTLLDSDFKCKVESNEIRGMIREINSCAEEYEKILGHKFEELRKRLLNLREKFNSIGLDYPAVDSLVKESEKVTDKNIEKVLSRITRAVKFYEDKTRFLFENSILLVPTEIEDYDELPAEDLLQQSLLKIKKIDEIFENKRKSIMKRYFMDLLKNLTISSVQNPDSMNLDIPDKIDQDWILKEKLKLVSGELSSMNWYKRYYGDVRGRYESYKDLKEGVTELSKKIISDVLDGVIDSNGIRNITCLKEATFIEKDTSGIIDATKLEKLSEERLVNDLLHFYGVQSIKARAIEELKFLVKERIVGLMREIRMNSSDESVLELLRQIDEIKDSNVLEAFIEVVVAYDKVVEKNFLKHETSRIINTIRPVIMECNAEIPGFKDQYVSVVNIMVSGNYKKGLRELNALITKGSGNLNYAKFLAGRAETLKKDVSLLDEDGHARYDLLKKLILESRYHEAIRLEFELESKIDFVKKANELNENKDVINSLAAELLINLLNNKNCPEPEQMGTYEEMITDLYNKSVLAEFNNLRELLESLEMKLDGSNIIESNIVETGYFIYSLRTNLLLKLHGLLVEKADYLMKDSNLVVITPLFKSYLEILTKMETKNSIYEIYLELKSSNDSFKKDLREWSNEVIGKDNVNMSVDLTGSINSFISSVEEYDSEVVLKMPFLYSKEEIEVRIDFLEKTGKREDIRIEDIENAITKIEAISTKFKNSLSIEWEKAKGDKQFQINAKVTNDGDSPLYDIIIHFSGQTQRLEQLLPGESKSISFPYNNNREEMLTINATTLGWKDFLKSAKVPAVSRYETYLEKGTESCRYCRGKIIKGVEALKCDYCGATYHLKCAQRAKKCTQCGMEFEL